MSSTVPVAPPLDIRSDDFRTLMAEVVALLSEFLDHLPVAPVFNPSGVIGFLGDEAVRRHPRDEGRPLQELLHILVRAKDIDLSGASGGGLTAIPGTGLVTSAVADLISGIFNRYTGLSAAAPAMVALESDILRWMADLLGLPPGAGGILTSGASMAILSAVACARSEFGTRDFRKGVFYATDQTHHALAKAIKLAGFPADAVHLVEADGQQRMIVDALRSAIAADRAGGRVPLCIAANAGSTSTGAIDPLELLAEIAKEEQLWLHVDAAYGGFFQLTARGRERLRGIEHADSIVLDPHKGLFVPFGTGCLLVRDRDALLRAHPSGDAPFLRDMDERYPEHEELPDFGHMSPELTRPNRGLRLWLPLHLHGVAAFREALDAKLDLAQQAYAALQEIPQLVVLGPPDLSILTFRCRLPQGTQAEEDEATEEIVRRINDGRMVLLGTTSIEGRIIARIAIMNQRTTAEVVMETVRAIGQHAAELALSA
jgi:aromatic-L-amino-acid decarboxylase